MRHAFSIDGRCVVVESDWSYNETSEGGLDTCSFNVIDSELRRLPTLPEEGSVVRATFDLDTGKGFKGEITLPPSYDERTGTWALTARGAWKVAEETTQPLLYQTRDTGLIKRSDSEPHAYTVDDGFGFDSRPGIIAFEVPRGEPHADNDRIKALIWTPGSLITEVRVSDINKLRNSAFHELLIRGGTGPDGVMATDGAAVGLDTGGVTSINRALSPDVDQVELALNVHDSNVAWLTNESRAADEDITIKSSSAQGTGTHTGGGVTIDDDLDSIVVTIDVSASSGAGREMEVDIQTSKDGGESWRTVGTETITGNGSTQVTVSDRLGNRVRYRSTINAGASFTYDIIGRTIPAGIFAMGGGTALPGNPASAEVTLTVDSITGTGKRLEVEVQTASDNQTRWRTIGTFQDFDAAGSQTIEVDNVADRLRLYCRIYGADEPTFQVDASVKLGYRRMRVVLREPRFNGRVSGDSMTMQAGMQDVAGLLSWDSAKVAAALSLNVLPSYWLGSWSELLIYWATALVDGYVGVWGEDDELIADKWSNADTVYAYRSHYSVLEVNQLPVYDDVLVIWENQKGVERTYPRTVDPALTYYEVRLADIQNNDDLAQIVRTNLQPDVQEARYHGRAFLQYVFLSPGGPMLPAEYVRPGMEIVFCDFGELRSQACRVTSKQTQYGGVTVGFDDEVTHTRFEEKQRLIASRRVGRRRRR